MKSNESDEEEDGLDNEDENEDYEENNYSSKKFKKSTDATNNYEEEEEEEENEFDEEDGYVMKNDSKNIIKVKKTYHSFYYLVYVCASVSKGDSFEREFRFINFSLYSFFLPVSYFSISILKKNSSSKFNTQLSYIPIYHLNNFRIRTKTINYDLPLSLMINLNAKHYGVMKF